MRKKVLLLAGGFSTVLLIYFLASFTRVGANYSLIVAQYNTANATTLMQDIYSYKFENGEFKGKEKIMSVVGKFDGYDYVRLDVGSNFIYRNRYVITSIGNLIDLQAKKALVTGRSTFVKCSGDSIVFYTNDIFKGKYYSVYDLKSNKHEQVKAVLYKPLVGQDVEIDYATTPRKIWLYPPDKDKVQLVSDAGYGEDLPGAKPGAQIPFIWLDNQSFLFPKYNSTKTECSIMKVTISGQATEIGKISGLGKSSINSSFLKDGKGNYFYLCNKGKFLVDVNGGKVTEVLFDPVGYGFEIECKSQPYGRMVKNGGTEIGKYHAELHTIKTRDGAIAFLNMLRMGAEVYPLGVAVWNNITKKWKMIEADDVAAVVGWIEN